MPRMIGLAPSAQTIEALARGVIDRLPQDFRRHLGDIVLQVEDFADEDVLADLEVEDPYELTGIYEGLALTERSIEHSGTMPDRIVLYRRPLIDEWASHGDVTFEHLVLHVIVHEIGHHFGLSDDDMHALEEAAG